MKIKRDSHGYSYVEGVKIKATLFRGPYVCTCCHSTGDATRISFQEAYWYKDALEVNPRALWLCNRCHNKLLRALNNPEEGKT